MALPVAAMAAVSAEVTSPAAGSIVRGAIPIQVEVARELLDPAPEEVEVRLSADGDAAAAGTAIVALRCVEGCSGLEQTWGAATFDPASGAPFTGGGMCNGDWTLQPRVDGGPFAAGGSLAVSVPPPPPRDVSAIGDIGGVALTWDRPAGTPDLVGFAVQRRDDGVWRTRATLGPDRTSHHDASAPAGEVEYRVRSLRGDGLGPGGDPLAPCSDDAPDLSADSPVVTASVPAGDDAGTADGGAGDDGDPAGDPDGPATTGDEPGTAGTGTPSGDDGSTGDSSATSGESAVSAGGGGTTGERRIAAPPAPRRTGADLSAPVLPDAPAVAAPEERYYGEGDGFSRELDYDGAELVTPAPDGTATGLRRIPGGVTSFVERFVDPERVAVPVAAGLLLLTVALHLRRWLNDARET